MYKKIPTYKDNEWGYKEFKTKEEFIDFLLTIFKEPGQYQFDETALLFNEQANIFNDQGYYCNKPFRSKDYIKYWNFEKEKCREGVIYVGKKNVFYVTRDYYMWLNFLPIFDKEEKKYGFAKVRDAQYHMALYELLAELHFRHKSFIGFSIVYSYFYFLFP